MPTLEMKKFYVERTERHIKRVKKWGSRINKEFGTVYNFDRHDASKLMSPEKLPYIHLTWFYKLKSEGVEYKYPPGVEEQVSKAVQHHYDVNPHHPEFHDEAGKEEGIDASPMKQIDIAEMCADWMAMSEEMGNDPIEWAKTKIGSKFIFTETQEEYIFELLEIFKKYVQD